jgi:predicted GTPase
MPHGAGYAAATAAGAAEIVDPRAAATPAIREVYRRYPHIGPVLPAVGYSDEQLAALAATIDASAAEVVVVATPIDLGRLVRVAKPLVRARYEFAEAGEPTLGAVIDAFVARTRLARASA